MGKPSQNNPWSDDEIEVLKDYYFTSSLSLGEMATEMGRTTPSISGMISKQCWNRRKFNPEKPIRKRLTLWQRTESQLGVMA